MNGTHQEGYGRDMDTIDASWSNDELARLRQDLSRTALELRQRIGHHRVPVPEGGDAADAADWSSQADFDLLMLERDRLLLQQSEYVIELIDQGRYGSCTVCGAVIPKARLQAHPQATMCLDCAHLRETSDV